ncbi:MAG: PBECR4 domain-containing protein [Acutalibacteraceae bacterium]
MDANYLIKTITDSRTSYIFTNKRTEENHEQFCRSFFFNDESDYTKNQITMTLLYKEKMNKITKTSIVQYNRLK